MKTQSLTPPEPTRNPTVETTINQNVDDAVISTVTSPSQSVTNPNQHIETGEPSSKYNAHSRYHSKPNPDTIIKRGRCEANFAGGIDGFRNKVLSNFDTSVVGSESGEVIKAVVTFVVERDGTISNIKAVGLQMQILTKNRKK